MLSACCAHRGPQKPPMNMTTPIPPRPPLTRHPLAATSQIPGNDSPQWRSRHTYEHIEASLMLGFMEVLYTITMAKLRLSQSTAEDPLPPPTPLHPHSHARVHTNSTQSSQYWAPYFRTDSRPTVTPWKLYPRFFLSYDCRPCGNLQDIARNHLSVRLYPGTVQQKTTNKTKRTTTTKQQMLALKSTSCCNKELVPPILPHPLSSSSSSFCSSL